MLQKTLEKYYKGNGRYPLYSKTEPEHRLIRLDDTPADWGESFTPYLEKLPKDPKNNLNYVYYSGPGGQSYFIYASLEREEKKELCNNGKACSSLSQNEIDPYACGKVCNYGVSSGNVTP